jgi:hypothetical protein
MISRFGLVVVLPVLCAALFSQDFSASGAPQTRRTATKKDELPPLSYVCPMSKDAEIVQAEGGKCPKCGMTLVPTRLISAWSCPVHPNVIEKKPGVCPIDKRPLVQITASVFWSCASAPDEKFLEPGRCADGHDRVEQFERRPHGDHNPRHGGQFFMADDNWHHLEGTLLPGGIFRVYFYNDFTQPIAPSGFSARVVLVDNLDKEIGRPVSLVRSPIRNALDGHLPGGKPPLNLKLTVKFTPADTEHLFDFTFSHVLQPSRGNGAAPAQTASTEVTSTPAPASPTLTLPTTTPALLAELLTQNGQVQSLLAGGALGDVWRPAITAKDIALALEDHENELSPEQRLRAASARKRLVLAAWQMDAYGDLGDRQKLNEAYGFFAAAVDDMRAAYGLNR